MESNHQLKPHNKKKPVSAHVTIIFTLIVILMLYAFLMLKDSVPVIGWAPLLILVFLYWRFSGKFNLPSPLDFPVLILLLLAGLSLTISLDKELALPKFYGLLLGVISYYFIVIYISDKRDLRLPIIALVVMPIVLALMGLVTSPRILSISFVSSFLSILPQISNLFYSTASNEIINPNTLAGALSFFVPLLISLLWDNNAYHRAFFAEKHERKIRVSYKVFAWIALVCSVIALVVSGSRGAIIGSLLGIFIVAVIRDRRFLWALPILILIGLLIVYVGLKSSLPELIIQSDINADLPTFQYRHEIWSYSLNILNDFPLTGIGLDQFNGVLKTLYFYQSEIFTSKYIAHSHNNFFAVAVELGLPGLVLYSSLIGAFFTMAWLSWQRSGPLRRVLIMSLTAGMAAYLFFGVMDAFTLGKKLGVFFWIFLGIITAIFQLNPPDRGGKQSIRSSGMPAIIMSVLWLSFWCVNSLLALSLASINTLFSFLLALFGGVASGFLMIKRWNLCLNITEPIVMQPEVIEE